MPTYTLDAVGSLKHLLVLVKFLLEISGVLNTQNTPYLLPRR